MGALAYADDIVLIAPTPFAMLRMLKICDDYANQHSIIFNYIEKLHTVYLKLYKPKL